MNNFDKIINECFEILDMIELLIEEKDYMFISRYHRILVNSIEFLAKNINNDNIITTDKIKKLEELADKTEETYNTLQTTDKEQQNLYKVYNQGIKPKIDVLRKLIEHWNKIHSDKKPLKTTVIENKIFNY